MSWAGGSGTFYHVTFHHATQNGAQFKTHELITSEIFHLIFLD